MQYIYSQQLAVSHSTTVPRIREVMFNIEKTQMSMLLQYLCIWHLISKSSKIKFLINNERVQIVLQYCNTVSDGPEAVLVSSTAWDSGVCTYRIQFHRAIIIRCLKVVMMMMLIEEEEQAASSS